MAITDERHSPYAHACPFGHIDLEQTSYGVYCNNCRLGWSNTVDYDGAPDDRSAEEFDVEVVIASRVTVLVPVGTHNGGTFHLPSKHGEGARCDRAPCEMREEQRGTLPENWGVCSPCVYGETGGKKGPTLADKIRAYDDPAQAVADHFKGDGT